MATYNGERYLCDQIDSILAQSYKNWDLYIRDDGSNDGTCAIILEYVNKCKRIHFVNEPFEKHGACINFYRLLKYAKDNLSKSDYFFLSDQDDIWETYKIEKEVECCEQTESKLVLAYSDLSLMSSDGSRIDGKMSNLSDIDLKNPNDIFFNQIFVWGNTICLSRGLLDLVRVPDDISNMLSHDHYLAFYGAVYGKVIYISTPLIKYRRHDDNVSGLPTQYHITTAFKRVLKKGNDIILGHAQNYNNVIYFINNAPYQTEVMTDIYRAISTGGVMALNTIRRYHINPGNNRYSALINKAILWSRVYKKYLKGIQ